jgi:hypothetical protein
LLREVAVAFESPVGEAGEGIEHAKIIERIGDEGVAEDFGSENGDGFADLGGSDLLSGLEAVDGISLGREVEGETLAKAALRHDPKFTEIILVATFLPATNGVVRDSLAVLTKVFDNVIVGQTIIEHFVDALADFLGQAGDIAFATASGRRGRE